jgi:hypothetical protein
MEETLMKKLFAVAIIMMASCCSVSFGQVPPEMGAVFGISYIDALDRDVSGTVTLTASAADLDIMLIGDDGSTHFTNVFPRFVEAGAKPEIEVVVFNDFSGTLGGSLTFEGFGLLSVEIGVGTIPSISAGSIVIWNQGGYASAGETGPATTDLVNVPEPAADVLICLMGSGIGLFLIKKSR